MSMSTEALLSDGHTSSSYFYQWILFLHVDMYATLVMFKKKKISLFFKNTIV